MRAKRLPPHTNTDGRAQPAHGHVGDLCDQQAAAVAANLALESVEVRAARLTHSGPKRFDYDADKDVWFTHKDGQLYLLHELLEAEFGAIFGKPLTVQL